MFQFIFPIVLVLASVGVFFGYTQKEWAKAQTMKEEVAEYNKAVENSKQLLKRRDELLTQKNQIAEDDLNRLNILVPPDVNSTKLILEIQNLASNVHGLTFENPKYDPNKKVTADVKIPTGDETTKPDESKTGATAVNPKDLVSLNKEYGTFELEFTVGGSYDKFIAFTKDLEQSLRLVDIVATQISAGPLNTGSLKYVIKVQTYWLKS